MVVGRFVGTVRSKDVPFVTPAVKMVPQRLAHLRVQEAVQQRYDEALCAQQNRPGDRKDVAPHSALVRSVDDDEVGDAQQRDKYEQGLRCLPVLARLERVGRPKLSDQDPNQ